MSPLCGTMCGIVEGAGQEWSALQCGRHLLTTDSNYLSAAMRTGYNRPGSLVDFAV